MGTVSKLRFGQVWACSTVISPSPGLSHFLPSRCERTGKNPLLMRPNHHLLGQRTCARLTSNARPTSYPGLKNRSPLGTKAGAGSGGREWSQARTFGLSACIQQVSPGVMYQTGWVPDQARVVICGGGVLGCSIAYHLAEAGWTDVLVLEQGSIGCGSSWHASGLVGQIKSSPHVTRLCMDSVDLYTQLEDQDHSVGWKGVGSLNVARTDDRMILFERQRVQTQGQGLECYVISPEEAKKICPLIRHEDIKGAQWVPSDGVISPTDVVNTLANLAKQRGVKIIEHCQVQRILTERYRVKGVETSMGSVTCEYFVNCGGQWAREIGQKSRPKVRVPLHSCEHYHILTKPIEEVDRLMPVVRDYDGRVYAREWGGGLLGGGFELECKPVFHDGIPEKFEFQLLPEDWDHFQVLLDPLLHRFPVMEQAHVQQLTNGPESFTPDGDWILGESPEVDNYYVAAGMNSAGFAGGAGVGKHMARWIMEGEPDFDFSSLDIRRFVDLHNNKRYLRDRVKYTLGYHAKLMYPNLRDEATGPTRLRTSVLHTRLMDAGAIWGQIMGYERAMYFTPDTDDYMDSSSKRPQGTFCKPNWFDYVEAEYWGCKERVCLIDMSSFAKFEIKSRNQEATDYLQYLCSNDIDKPLGTIIHTGMHNSQGGYENDTSVVRLDENYYFMISPTSQQTRSLNWLHKKLPKDSSVQIRDVTSLYAGINVVGPRAQDLLAELTDASTKKADFPIMSCQEIDVGHASGIRALRLTHSGEDGFILYIPSELTIHVYDALMRAGRDYGIMNAGYYALRILRMEKFFAYWGLDLSTHTTPLECGRDFRVRFDKDFIGKEALLKQREEGISKKLVHFTLVDHDKETDLWPWGGEPILRNGQFVGTTTSSGYGYSLQKMVCMGFVKHLNDSGEVSVTKNMSDYILDKNATYEVDIAGKRFVARARIHTPREALTTTEPLFIPVPARSPLSGTASRY